MAAKKSKTVPNKPAAKAAPAVSPPPALADVRAKIDEIDRGIQALIAERAHFAHQVGKAKGKLAAAVDYYRPEREAQVLRMVVDRNEGPLSDEVLVHVFREIMSACLAQQEPLKIGYLGPEGTFSQQAVLKHFGRSAVGQPMASIEEVFQEVEAGNADFGVVPVENSGQGTIQVTLDMFLTSNLKICGEVELRVHQFLLSRSGRLEDIERIYGHPQSFAQTAGWLRSNLPKVEKLPVSSNAEGAPRAQRRGCRRHWRRECRARVWPEEGHHEVDRGRRRQHHALPGDRSQDIPAVGPRPHFDPGVHPRQARRAVRCTEPVRPPRHQHEPDRVAALAPGQVGSTASSSTWPATSRTRR